MSVVQYARITVAENALNTPHDRTARNRKPPTAQKRVPKPAKLPIKTKSKKPYIPKPQAKYGLFHHLGKHIANWWHSLTRGQQHIYAKIHPRSPISRVHRGRVIPRNVDHAQAKAYHDTAAQFHQTRAQVNTKKGNVNRVREHNRAARQHINSAVHHARKVK
jgi:hypothetical protein